MLGVVPGLPIIMSAGGYRLRHELYSRMNGENAAIPEAPHLCELQLVAPGCEVSQALYSNLQGDLRPNLLMQAALPLPLCYACSVCAAIALRHSGSSSGKGPQHHRGCSTSERSVSGQHVTMEHAESGDALEQKMCCTYPSVAHVYPFCLATMTTSAFIKTLSCCPWDIVHP